MAISKSTAKKTTAPAKAAKAPAAKTAKATATKAAKAPAAKPAAKPAAAAKKTPAAKGKPARRDVPAEQRRNYIEVAAYYIAERHGFTPGRELSDWAAAEAEIDRLLATGLLNP